MKWVNGVSGNFVTIKLTVFKHSLLGEGTKHYWNRPKQISLGLIG